MNILTPNSPPPSTLRFILAAACVAAGAIFARAQNTSQLDIGVRPKVTDKSNIYAGKTRANPGSGGHSKIYGILSVQEIKADYRLVKPVNEQAIMELLSAELNKQGFKLYTPGTKPDIVITASYGRGELENPYIRDGGETGGDYRAGAFLGVAAGNGASMTGAANDSGATTSVITGAFPQQLWDEKSPGYQAKLQKASFEKLFIRVTAWAYPTEKKGRAKMLWKTIVVVDDPDHRDLNVVAAKMLEAASPYFDREIRDPEVNILQPLPDGRVNVGSPEVVSAKTK